MTHHGLSIGAERVEIDDFRDALLRMRLDLERGLDLKSATVDDINRALARIDNGSFGFCSRCYLLMPRSELIMRPYSDCCSRCMRRGSSRPAWVRAKAVSARSRATSARAAAIACSMPPTSA